MNTFIVQADSKVSKALIAIFKALNVTFEVEKNTKNIEKSPYDPEFVKMVLERTESAKNGHVIEYTPELREKWFGK
jgi:2-polyprenyl-3-methyl-5-hydroxy-6-metoxy-1,4-benzoquinol methylase